MWPIHDTARRLSSPRTNKRLRGDTNCIEVNDYDYTVHDDVLLLRRFARPLPFSETLVDVSDQRQSVSPLVRKYYQSIGKEPPRIQQHSDDRDGDESLHENDRAEKAIVPTICSMEDSRWSKLTEVQHRRFLQWSSVAPTAKNDRNEFKKIKQLVKEEQALYRNAIRGFWMALSNLMYLGWTMNATTLNEIPNHATTRAFVHAFFSRYQRASACYSPTQYGKCRQLITLLVDSGSMFSNLTMDSVTSRILSSPSGSNKTAAITTTIHDVLPQLNQAIPIPQATPSTTDTPLLLKDDTVALHLAKIHAVDILISANALYALLGLVNDPSSTGSLSLGTTRHGDNENLLVVEEPLTLAFASPRQALEYGFQEGLYQWFDKQEQEHNKDESTTTRTIQYQYTLLEFPRTGRKPLLVLIRSHVRILYQKQDTTRRPVHLSASIEYGWATYNTNNRLSNTIMDHASCWILNHWLETRTVLARVDPTTCQVVQWDEPSVAHALAGTTSAIMKLSEPGDHSSTKTALDDWKTCAQFLSSLTTIGRGSHLVCVPAMDDAAHTTDTSSSFLLRRSSASVHASISTSVEVKDTSATIITIGEQHQKQLWQQQEMEWQENASETWMRCFRDWQWNHPGRVPYTFPVRSDRTTTGS